MNTCPRPAAWLNGFSAQVTSRLRNERGAAMAEYGLLLAMVALAAIGILLFLGAEILELFTGAEDDLNTRAGVPGPTDVGATGATDFLVATMGRKDW